MFVWIVFAAVIFLFLALLFHHPYFFQDVHHVLLKLKLRRLVRKYYRTNYTMLDRFLDVVKAQPHKPFILFKDEIFTYRDADELSNKAARVLLYTGLVKEGDTVALFLGNEPMFLWLWLGLVKIGCSAAFLNYNIRSRSLLHCFNCSGAKTLIAAEELQDAVEEVLPSLLEQQVSVFILADRCTSADFKSFSDKMSQASSEPIPKNLRSHLTLQSTAAYIYTSGTTGFPKAAVVTHSKLWSLSLLPSVAGVNSEDVVYDCLPLYHAAGFLGFTGAIEMGITMALRSKFSASLFWDDCRKYNVTVIQYIGEIMRYLCNTPRKLNDRRHKVRLAIGNGVRTEVWREFNNRFGNIQIREFYGATEGNVSLLNYTGKIGAVGRDTFLHKNYFPYSLIKFDVDKEKPVRDSAGLCIEAAKGEPGLLVCEISMNAPFSGYARDLQQTEKKRLHNVHKKGDLYFNTGDLLSIDEDNFIYFQDRVGDTFRWKGENVSTNEVADVITQVDYIKEANVYGVTVPVVSRDQCPGHKLWPKYDKEVVAKCGRYQPGETCSVWLNTDVNITLRKTESSSLEGRVGMTAVKLSEGQSFDSVDVFKHVVNFLPAYARPRFIRIRSSLDVTGTFKHLKTKLVEEGFNPNQITDPLYFLDEKDKNYIPLTVDIFNSVTSGKVKI